MELINFYAGTSNARVKPIYLCDGPKDRGWLCLKYKEFGTYRYKKIPICTLKDLLKISNETFESFLPDYDFHWKNDLDDKGNYKNYFIICPRELLSGLIDNLNAYLLVRKFISK